MNRIDFSESVYVRSLQIADNIERCIERLYTGELLIMTQTGGGGRRLIIEAQDLTAPELRTALESFERSDDPALVQRAAQVLRSRAQYMMACWN